MKLHGSSGPARPSAFTLVELLVVIGILAVLIALVLPAIGRANATARRAACLSNLRQVHVALLQYAAVNRGQVPVGYRDGRKQFNSMIYSATSGQYVLFGLLYRAGLMNPPKVFFCPAENNPQAMLATSANPWPAGPDGDPSRHGYCGYGFRPEVEIPDDLTASTTPLPKLSSFKHNAILADLTAMPARIATRHRSGINVLYGDGSARWVDLGIFQADLAPCTSISVIYNPNQQRIWQSLDRQ